MSPDMHPLRSVLVAGDVMLDVWQEVEPTRVSGEAPVLVALNRNCRYSPGGAGNAAVNVAHLGVPTTLIGLIGIDDAAAHLQQALFEQGVSSQVQPIRDPSSKWVTIEKRRVVDTLGRHILRIDTESEPDSISEKDRVALYVARGQQHERSVLFISDYGKGTMNEDFVRHAIASFREQGKFVIVNGKPEHIDWYRGASALVFNRAEAEAAVGRSEGVVNGGVTNKLYDYFNGEVRDIIMTDGDKGLYWRAGGAIRHFRAHKVEVADVGGAGDTISATIAAHGTVSPEILNLAVQNAARVVSQRGTSVPK